MRRVYHRLPDELESSDRLIRRVMRRHPGIHLVVLFGSLSKGGAHQGSDLDIAVGAGQPLDAAWKMQLIMELAEATGRPVDLVDFSVIGEPLLGQILVGGRKILGENSELAKLFCRHLFEQADFMPYRRRILEERRQKWIGL